MRLRKVRSRKRVFERVEKRSVNSRADCLSPSLGYVWERRLPCKIGLL